MLRVAPCIARPVDLDGGWGEDILHAHLRHFKEGAPERFQIFGGVDWSKWKHGRRIPCMGSRQAQGSEGGGRAGVEDLETVRVHVKDDKGQLVKVDDVRLIPIWETAGELGLPVLVHVADPVAFFDPIDETNERWEEIGAHPDWAFTSPPFPSFMEIMNGFYNLVKRHASTTFIGAHVGCYGENLGWVGKMLEDCPNYYIDISARLGELGRHPTLHGNFLSSIRTAFCSGRI